MTFLYARSGIFIFHKKCSCPHFLCFCCCKKAKHEAEEHAITCWRLERYLKVSWLLLVSAQSVGTCIFKTRGVSEGHPSWKMPGPSTVSIVVLTSYQRHGHTSRLSSTTRWDLRWEGGICLSASVCVPNSEFSARLFLKLICQWELCWSSSGTLKNALWSTDVSCSSLQMSEVFSVKH